jgi:hypothetical protein
MRQYCCEMNQADGDEKTAAGAPRRGRPPGPSLAVEAVDILERNAFAALRGPNSRGAVPRGAFASVDVSTVDRSVKRAFAGAPGRTPFDLASHQVCGTPDATRETMEAVFAAVAQSFRETDAMEETLRVFLRANFIEACREEGLLAASIVTSAACAHLSHEDHEIDTEQSKVAREIVEMRRLQTKELVEGFVAGLSIAMRRLKRRPKPTVTMEKIVLAIMASTDGFIHLHFLQPNLSDADLVVETQWGIMWSLSEPGLLDPPNRADDDERRIVDAALRSYAANIVPSIETLARDCDVNPQKASALFPDDAALAQRCMDYAVGNSVETEAIAINVKGAEVAAVRDLLIATTRQAAISPLLIEIVRRDTNVGFCGEARRHIAEALSQSTSVSLDSHAAEGVAVMLIDAAMQGEAGLRVWQAGLDAFSADAGA